MALHARVKLTFLDLPNELISNILSFLDSSSPFEEASKRQPAPLLRLSTVQVTPLKQASCISHRIRKLALPLLYRNVHLKHQELKRFLSFTSSNNLTTHITSVIVYIQSFTSHYHPPWWSQLLYHFPSTTTLSIVAPPHIFPEITKIPSSSPDTWAFQTPLQILHLKTDTPTPFSLSPSANTNGNMPSLLTSHPWNSLLINESSSLHAYTTYEYFLRRTPTPIPSTASTASPSPTLNPLLPFLTSLHSFTFIAIFPFYNHVGEICRLLKLMTSLRHLEFKLLPDPDSTVLIDTIEKTGGHFDVNDPWNEFETSLALVVDAVRYLSSSTATITTTTHSSDVVNQVQSAVVMSSRGLLEELVVHDVAILGVRDSVTDALAMLNSTGVNSVDAPWEPDESREAGGGWGKYWVRRRRKRTADGGQETPDGGERVEETEES